MTIGLIEHCASSNCILSFLESKEIRNLTPILVYYQPILSPHTNKIIGFECLLRLLVDDNKVLSPYHFIKEIEDNDMLFEVFLWILQRIVKTSPLISNHINNRNIFYISINLSLNEI